jgi:DNA helicase-2/ATP-dependent DNA helicase PcrA
MQLSTLNKNQLAAVNAPLGPVLVIAGAGSGKTKVLTYRIAQLIVSGQVAPENILALTFTNKAAKEMIGRIEDLLKGDYHAKAITMGTFHSVCAKILRREIAQIGYNPNFNIYDSDDQLSLIKSLIKERGLEDLAPGLVKHAISSAKNQMQTPDSFTFEGDKRLFEKIKLIYTDYQNSLYKFSSLDFDDLLLLTVKIFESLPKTLKKYQETFKYILVDEYQDTNPVQYRLLKLLGTHRNLFVVGDDAQSIYKFRGSTIRNILEFESDFTDAKVFTLDQNYRSTGNILAVAQKVIELNKEQKPKKLWTESSEGERVVVEETGDETAEAHYVAKKIIQLSTGNKEEVEEEGSGELTYSILDQFLKKAKKPSLSLHLPKVHGPLSRFAVLYRTHAQSRSIEEAFISAGIPYVIFGGFRFYERAEVKDFIAYFRLILNFSDQLSLKRVINTPGRGLGEKTQEVILNIINTSTTPLTPKEVSEKLDSTEIKGAKLKSAKSFFELLDRFSKFDEKISLKDWASSYLKETGLIEFYKDGSAAGDDRVLNLKEIINVVSRWEDVSWKESLVEFMEDVALLSDADKSTDKDAVTLMTLHSAKGLEFDTVFFIGLEEGIVPHSRSLLDSSELAEEVRLVYVGLTRAKKELFLTYAKSRTLYGSFQVSIPSRFIKVLPAENIIRKNKPKSFLLESEEDGLKYESYEE